jgi:hypothetical protein
MTRTGLLTVALAFPALIASPALAQEAPIENADSRFNLFQVEDGYLRLDGRTGQVSICSRRQAHWLCQTLPEERAALESEIARLQGDNAALAKELLAHQLPLPAGMVRSDPALVAGPPPRAPADRELTQVLTAIETVWRRLVAMIASVQRDLLKKS